MLLHVTENNIQYILDRICLSWKKVVADSNWQMSNL